MPKAKETARRAIALNDGVADAHFVLAQVHQIFDWDLHQASREYQRAIELNPTLAEARSVYASLLLELEGVDAALLAARRAVESDPLSSLARHHLAVILLETGRVETAVEEARTGVQLADGFSVAHWILMASLATVGRYEEAVSVARRAVTLSPDDPNNTAMLAWACSQAGRRDEATRILKQLEDGYQHGRNSAIAVTHASLALGHLDQTFGWLSKAYDERDGWLCWVNTWPTWKPLRSDPRFQALLRKMNFPQVQGN